MNWIDFLVIGVIVLFAIIGLKTGFIMSVFKILAFFAAAILSVKFYPVMSSFLSKTFIFTSIKAAILKNLLMQNQSTGAQINTQANLTAQNAISNLHFPKFLNDILIKQVPDVSQIFDFTSVMDKIAASLALVVIDIISVVLVYILVRIGLVFVKFILSGIAKLPLFKQIDKAGGIALGAVEGILTIYILCAILMIFYASPQFKQVVDAVDSSLIAKFFYNNNFIVNWIFPK